MNATCMPMRHLAFSLSGSPLGQPINGVGLLSVASSIALFIHKQLVPTKCSGGGQPHAADKGRRGRARFSALTIPATSKMVTEGDPILSPTPAGSTTRRCAGSWHPCWAVQVNPNTPDHSLRQWQLMSAHHLKWAVLATSKYLATFSSGVPGRTPCPKFMTCLEEQGRGERRVWVDAQDGHASKWRMCGLTCAGPGHPALSRLKLPAHPGQILMQTCACKGGRWKPCYIPRMFRQIGAEFGKSTACIICFQQPCTARAFPLSPGA